MFSCEDAKGKAAADGRESQAKNSGFQLLGLGSPAVFPKETGLSPAKQKPLPAKPEGVVELPKGG